VVRGVAYDTPISGYGVGTANLLRLWKSEAAESFDLRAFNQGDYYAAVEQKMQSENLTKILYPNDDAPAGKQLRLEQQYFFVSCALQDMIRIHLQTAHDLNGFAQKYAIQLNDTHPSLAVPELMRLLVDEQGMEWEPAWEITRATFSYTNHTLLPEALERWAMPLFAQLLPRHLQIVFEINRRFLNEVRTLYPGDDARVSRMSLIDETPPRYVRMANLATVGSCHINGVAALHTDLLKRELLRDFAEMWPKRFSNKTNGVTPRRFMVLSNPRLTALISSAIGTRWITHLEELKALEPLAEDTRFRSDWRKVKLANKERLAHELTRRTGVVVDPTSLFDLQFKRLHEYKRQHLNLLRSITLYQRIKRTPKQQCDQFAPRTVLFGGKAAPGYEMAKLIIKLINDVASTINNDPDVHGMLKIAFFPDYNVKSSQIILPAADLSEQISLAGKEASGTGNMKLGLNGALTIGTLDGANVEIREEVGADNFFLFGMTQPEVEALKASGYRPYDYYQHDPDLRAAIDAIANGTFSRGDREIFRPIVENLLHHDEFMALADYRAYLECQEAVAKTYRDPELWSRMSILNVARMGKFSSDRAIREYCDEIWHVQPEAIGG
jgi:starch phosphorylase